MELTAIQKEIEGLKGDLVEITKLMKDRSNAEVKELGDKLTEIQKELATRKHQFDSAAADQFKTIDAKVLDQKRDELLIARALLRNEDGRLNKSAYAKTVTSAEYRDAVKASGFTFDGSVPDGQVSGGDGTAAGYGSDFVVEGFSKTLLQEIWLKLEVANLFKRFNMPNATFIFPFAHDRITARLGKEAVAPNKDKFETGTLQFTAKKVMANIDFTDELEQDSIIAILPLIREKLIEGFALAQEQIALNGDATAGAGNIHGAGLGADDVRRAVGGIRLAAKTAGDTVDFGGTFSADKLRDLRAKMGKYGKNPSDLVYLISMADYFKCLKFEGYQYLYQYDGAVITRGELGRIDNIPLLVTELLPENLNASGVYDGVTTTKKTVGVVNKEGFMWGDRKEFSLETFRNPYQQVNSLIGSQRLDFQKIMSSASHPVAFGINY
jgi:HK97 family phage major capsid protein